MFIVILWQVSQVVSSIFFPSYQWPNQSWLAFVRIISHVLMAFIFSYQQFPAGLPWIDLFFEPLSAIIVVLALSWEGLSVIG